MALLFRPTLGLDEAQSICAAAAQTAAVAGVQVCVAVTDPSGHLLAFSRMDDAPLLSIQLAQDKAYSVTAFKGLPTEQWWPLIQDEPALVHGIVKTDRLVVFGGGAPVLVDAALVGAVGVSGGTAEQDASIARAAASVVTS